MEQRGERGERGGRPVPSSQQPTGGDKSGATRKQYFRRKKVCRFCVEKVDDINYKDVRMLSSFLTERAKIIPRRLSGVCTPHQKRLAEAIKQARSIALVPFSPK
jgi:small subunit ribosomal protein S18